MFTLAATKEIKMASSSTAAVWKPKDIVPLPPIEMIISKVNSAGNFTISFSRNVTMPSTDVTELSKLLFHTEV